MRNTHALLFLAQSSSHIVFIGQEHAQASRAKQLGVLKAHHCNIAERSTRPASVGRTKCASAVFEYSGIMVVCILHDLIGTAWQTKLMRHYHD